MDHQTKEAKSSSGDGLLLMQEQGHPPASVFDAIANDDLEGLVYLFAMAAHDAVTSYVSFRKEWQAGTSTMKGRMIPSDSIPMHSVEEKRDEYFNQQSPPKAKSLLVPNAEDHKMDTAQDTVTKHDESPTKANFEESDLANIADKLNDIILSYESQSIEHLPKDLSEQTSQPRLKTPQSNSSIAAEPPTDDFTRTLTTPHGMRRMDWTTTGEHYSRLDSNSNCLEEEMEQIVRKTLSAVSNARPSASLTVYSRDKITLRKQTTSTRNELGSTATIDTKSGLQGEHMSIDEGNANADSLASSIEMSENNSEAEDAETEENTDQTTTRKPPPLFDGSVANATPGGNLLSLGGGGAGTALHLACVLDSPFALALLLAMDADASSRHTAFRRLMIHEASCANSPECLELLLELAKKFKGVIQANMPTGNDETAAAAAFFGLPLDQMGNGMSGQRYYQSLFGSLGPGDGPVPGSELFGLPDWKLSLNDESNPDGIKQKPSPMQLIDVLTTAWKLVRKLRGGLISDLEASRALLSTLELPRGNKVALAYSCPLLLSKNGNTPPLLPPTAVLNYRPLGSSDGHGNSALHWASFKNSSSCVSILLAHDADPNVRATTSGWTPLHDAAYSDAAQSISLLVGAGADVNACANSGATPLCFACQEDSPNAALVLVEAGADPGARCCGHSSGHGARTAPNQQNHQPSRFSGYTPLHYCAHYNAHRAARVLLDRTSLPGQKTSPLLEVPDLNEKLPIYVAVARGSSDVLRELLHSGARIDIKDQAVSPSMARRSRTLPLSNPHSSHQATVAVNGSADTSTAGAEGEQSGPVDSSNPSSSSSRQAASSPVSSPLLRSLIPTKPITSSKPWNCLTQRSIDECRTLIRHAELSWAPERHSLFHPTDRRAALELFCVGKRLEQMGTGIFLEFWPYVLSFCGRGWFEPDRIESTQSIRLAADDDNDNGRDEESARVVVEFANMDEEETLEIQIAEQIVDEDHVTEANTNQELGMVDGVEFTQFRLEG